MRQQGGFFYTVKIIMILVIIGAGFFCGQKAWAVGSTSIIISEVQVAGKTVDDEFIELYNSTERNIDISGWSIQYKGATGLTFYKKNFVKGAIIPAHSFFLIVNTAANQELKVLADMTYSVFSLSGGIQIGGGGNIFLVNDQKILNSVVASTIVDKVAYGLGDSPEIMATLLPSASTSIERKPGGSQGNGQDTDNNNVDFFIQKNPNPQNSSSPATAPTPPPAEQAPENPPNPLYQGGETASSTDQNTTPLNPPLSGGTDTGGIKINFGDVLINEFVSDPADNEVEWIELYNKTNSEIDLTGWRLEEGSKAKTVLSGSLGASGAERYKIIEKPAGNLNNDGDLIVLYDATGKIIDQVAYGSWNDGNTTDNASVAHDPDSTARKFDGYNTFNNANDFAVTIKPTKGASNIIQIEDEVSLEAKAKFDFASDIFISEILPNPTGDDAKLEFIEIYNAGKREVNLTGWSLSNEDGKKKNWENVATGTIIKAGEYLAVFRPSSKIVLHNDSGEVRLYQPLADKPSQIVKYKNVKEGWGYNLVDYKIKSEWVWSETITPGAMNAFKTINHQPEVVFSFKSPALINAPVMFDSSDTNDVDGDILKYSWDFGDGFKNNLANPEHTYLKTGVYKVRLEVSDGKETGEKEKNIKVVGSVGEMVNVLDSRLRGNDKTEEAARNDKIIINEIFPNPKGADTNQEWVELKNSSEAQINLLNWRVENSNGKYRFASAQFLKAGVFYVLNNLQSKLAFKNTDDVISLYNDLDELVDQVEYASAVQGEAYARGANGKWFWTTKITPAKENIISLAGSKSEIVTKATKAALGADGYIETTLEKIKELDIGSLVIVKGTVAVEPGVLGVQIFYIVGSPGMQVYNYKKDFPALRIGDYIEVAGELTQAQGEFRIKTKDKSDINLIEHKALPVALAVKGDEVSEENIGQLIAITGEITDKKSASLYIDDGSGEIYVYIKQNTGIDAKSLATGQKVSVTGILSKTQTGLRLLPRYQADIVLIDSAGELMPQVLGEVAAGQEWDLVERDKKLELFKYLLIIAGGVIIVLAGLFIKLRGKN